MRFLSLILVISFALFFAVVALADKPGVMYDAPFPVTPKLDGNFGEWSAAKWHKVTSKMGWAPLPKDDADGSLEFACIADNTALYVAVKISDDAKVVGENTGGDVWQDDSVEIYIDGGNEKAAAYDKNDAQITIGRDNVGGDVNNPKMGGSGPRTGIKAAVVDTGSGWAVEAAIPLTNHGIKPAVGTVIGFNMQLNDDDDKAGRDHKLAWSASELAAGETSWNNPRAFAELQFIAAPTAVSSSGKLISTWASIKR